MIATAKKPLVGRREARRNDRREAMIAVAYESFLEHGYAATSMSAIAAAVGGSKATLWSYFPSKEALFEAVLDQATRRFREQLIPLLDPQADLERTLRSFCLRFLEKLTDPRAIALYRLVQAESGRFPEIGRIFYERGPRTTSGLLAGFLRTAIDRGLMRSADPLDAAYALLGLCMCRCHLMRVLGASAAVGPDQIAEDADRAVDVFLSAYRA